MSRFKLYWRQHDAERAVTGGTEKGLYEAAEYLLEYANRTVPFEEGILAGSGGTIVDAGRMTAVVYYDTPYAVRQHEDTRLRHDPGRRAKWLEESVNEEKQTLFRILADHIGRALLR